MATESPTYEELGIFPETWACVAVMSKADATRYLFCLAASGVPALVSRDADGKRWHVAVQGGLKNNPLAWIVSVRGEPYTTTECPLNTGGQHPRGLQKATK